MAFKGTIPVGTEVSAELTLANSARGPALFLIAWSAGGSTGEEDSAIVNPGETRGVRVLPTEPSLLRVLVDMRSQRDQGELTVHPVTPPEPVTGDTTWVYSVE
jgi:hypothetical protein